MQLFIIAIGKGRVSPENSMAHNWLSRLQPTGQLIEVESKLPPGLSRTTDESRRLLTHAAKISLQKN